MDKFFASKWGKFLFISVLSTIMIIVSIVIGTSIEDGGVVMFSIMLFVALPILYFGVVIINYLRLKLTKFLRWLLVVVALLLALAGTLVIFIMPFAYLKIVSDVDYGVSFSEGCAYGSVGVFAILYYDFEKLGYSQKNAEKRNWLQNVIFYSLVFIGVYFLGGILMLIVKAINQGWLHVVLVIVIGIFTIGEIVYSIQTYGLPLGNDKENKEWLDKYNAKTPAVTYVGEPKSGSPKPFRIQQTVESFLMGVSSAYGTVSHGDIKIGQVKASSNSVTIRFSVINIGAEIRVTQGDVDECYNDAKEKILSKASEAINYLRQEYPEMGDIEIIADPR